MLMSVYRQLEALLAENDGLKAAVKDLKTQLDNGNIALDDLHQKLNASERWATLHVKCFDPLLVLAIHFKVHRVQFN